MIALVLFTCLTSGGDCRAHVQAEGIPSPIACQASAQIVAAQWAGEHPGRRIFRIICTDARSVGQYIGRDQA
jgi:hypothetical protein